MSTKLWGIYDGEPFMQNPRLGIIYPNRVHKKGRKKGKKAMARRKHRKGRQPAALKRYWASHRKGRKHTSRRRRRSRRNWINTGALSAVNPRRRRRHHRNIRHHRRHHYRRNPALLGFELPAVKTVIFAGVGFASPPLVQGFLSSMAPSITQSLTSFGLVGKYIIKAGSVLGVAWIVRRFVGSSESHAVLVGGGVNVALSLVNDFAPGFLPANPLAMYIPTRPGMRAYVPARPGLRSPEPGSGRRMMSVIPGGIPTAAPFRALATSGPWGSASRYQRY